MKNKRVGTITMAVVLIVLGFLIFMSQINKSSTLNIALKLWPAILILLGMEILYYRFIHKEDVIIKYDLFSIFMVFVILMTNLGLFAMAEAGVLSEIQVMASTEYYNTELVLREMPLEADVKKIIIDDLSNNISIRAIDGNTIGGLGSIGFRASKNASTSNGEISLNYKKSGDTVYITSIEYEGFDDSKYANLHDISLKIPKNIDVEIRESSTLDLIYEDFDSNFTLDGVHSVKIRLDNDDDIRINAYSDSENELRGNVEWSFGEYGQYINGEGKNTINILKPYEVEVNKI